MDTANKALGAEEEPPMEVMFQEHPAHLWPRGLPSALPAGGSLRDAIDERDITVSPRCLFLRKILRTCGPNDTPVVLEKASLSEIITRIRAVLQGEIVSLRNIVEIISCEPELEVEVIRLANSAIYNPACRMPSRSLRAAVLRIGFNQYLQNHLIAYAVRQLSIALTPTDYEKGDAGAMEGTDA